MRYNVYYESNGLTPLAQIKKFYGQERAKRSGVLKINHILEGMNILVNDLGADDDTVDAYLLHPMIQSDEDLKNNFNIVLAVANKRTVMLAMEYRNIANAYLSRRKINSIEEIALSPLSEVQKMLIADKIQNCKDFERHNMRKMAETDPEHAAELGKYFANWFLRLGISDEFYQMVKNRLTEQARKTNNPE